MRARQKNWQLLLLCLVAVTLIAFFANVPLVEAQSSARLRLIQSDTSRIILELEVSGYDSRDVTVGGATYTMFSIGDLVRTGEPGKPQLPVKGTMIGIPPGAQPTLRIVDDQAQTITVPRHPLPAPTITAQRDPRQTLPGPTSQSFAPNAATYSANQFYPSAASKIGTTGDWRSQHYATVQFYPLQYNPVTRQLVLHRRLRVEITLSYPRGQSPATLGGALNEGAFESVFQNAFINYSSAKNWRLKATPIQRSRAASPSVAGDLFRIGVNADGVYKVTCGQLATAKGSTLNITPSTIHLVKQVFTTSVESAINVVGTGWGTCNSSDTSDYIEFYGLASTSKYTNTNTYWLTYGGSAGIRMPQRDGSIGGGVAATTFTKTNHLEQNLIYRPNTPQIEGYEHWYWELLYSAIPARDYEFQIGNFVSNSISATLSANLIGGDLGGLSGHHSRVWLNNCSTIDDFLWSGRVVTTAILSIPNSCVNPITNTVHITESNENPYTYTVIYTNYFDFSYQSGFTATNDSIQFRQSVSNTWQYNIDGYSNSGFKIFDITDPLSVTRILTPTVLGVGPFQLQFTDPVTTTAREYLALTNSKLISPTIAFVSESDLYSSSNGADYIIVTASPFKSNPQLLSLVSTRSAQFSRPVKLVDVQDIYDQFGDGLADPQAIHDFLQYAYSNWTSPAPQFVLLVGGGTFDPKGYCASPNPCDTSQYQTPTNSTLLAPYLRMVDPDQQVGFGETDSDNCLVSFSTPCSLITHTLPYMSIGRLPADTSSDVTALINKILNYENPVAGSWRSIGAFVTDNSYEASGGASLPWGGDFWAFSEEIAGNKTYFPSGLRADRIYYNPCTDTITYTWCALPYPSYSTYTSTHSAILSAINSGRLIVNYIGHGNITNWAQENLFSGPSISSDLSSLTNGNKMPLMLELTCRTGYFIYPHPDNQSLAKMNVNLPGKGAVASWAAVGVGFVNGHDALEKGFFNAVMNLNTRQLGPATTAGKANLLATGYNLDLLDTIILFGDPASRLAVQFSYYLPLILK